jgi:tol-pal system protein YbgF
VKATVAPSIDENPDQVIMNKTFRLSFVVAVLAGTAISSPGFAQSAGDAERRLNQMEEQMRMLVGQVEELTFTVKQLQGQVAAGRKTGAAEPVQQAKPVQQKSVQTLKAAEASTLDSSIESTDLQVSTAQESVQPGGIEQIEDVAAAPAAPRKLGEAVVAGGLSTLKSAQPDDGGFQGQVLVAPGGEEVTGGGAETVALDTEDPQSLYRAATQNAVDRQYAEAEQGFSAFLQKYPKHSLAGAAQYWLGETYYAQGDFRTAAQNFLKGYQDYPKSRRAPDSLLKLGLSLRKMGEKERACASLAAVSSEFPNAVEAKKRAQIEFRRSGC